MKCLLSRLRRLWRAYLRLCERDEELEQEMRIW
jgi:hypothetical protein